MGFGDVFVYGRVGKNQKGRAFLRSFKRLTCEGYNLAYALGRVTASCNGMIPKHAGRTGECDVIRTVAWFSVLRIKGCRREAW